MRTRTLPLFLATVAALVIAACGSGSSDTASPAFNDDDVMFAQMMIPHHEQAIELADIALDPAVGASDDVRKLATDIKSAQDPEIERMTSLLTSWEQPLTADPSVDHGSMMKGMLTVEELDALGTLVGAEFDRAWLEAMIAHHEGAVGMATEVRETGINPDIAELADDVATTQSSEIQLMTSLVEE